jgi:hypothetical protein
MRKSTILLHLILCTCGAVSAQQGTIKGVIRDTSEQKELPNAVIAVLRQSDSIMQAFTRSQPGGAFIIKNIPPGQYLLMVTYPKFADYIEPFSIKSDSLFSFGPISLIRKSELLKEVIVTQKASAIRMKGDTLEFKADSFKVKEGATVEELLKKLPGIQVNSKGEITAQGEKVQKVLVDGEEFFGDDPTLVTQNLRADMVDRVQVFDKKSDQAAFTGIDDGQKTKTINLKLKDDKKNGYFGKVTAGGGTNGYFDDELMVNMFKKKEKLALYGILSNTGKTGLNWTDRNTYGQNIADIAEYDEDNGYFHIDGNFDELDNWNGSYQGQGYPTVKTGGVHYNNKWNDDRQTINGNYKFMQLSVNGENTTNTENILPDTLYYNNQHQTFNNQIFRNRADGNYEIKFDSTSSIKITADAGKDHKITSNHFTSQALAADSALINSSTRDVSTTADIQTLNSNIIWRKRLPKKGRTLSINFNEKYQSSTASGYLYSENNFYTKDTLSQQQLTDQYKDNHSQDIQLDSKLTYTEPLSGSSFIAANYGFALVNSSSDRSSFNKSASGKYTELDPLYSNDYRFNVFTHRGGLSYSLVKKQLRFSAGSNIGLTNFEQKDVHADTSSTRHFVNWYPQASLSWTFNPQSRLSLHYDGSTTQPTIQQIQPTSTNEDPLNIIIGNPALKPQFANNLSLNFNDYKILSQRYIYGGLRYTATQNFIGTRDNVDSTGKRVSQSVNLNGSNNFSGYAGYYFKWDKPGLGISINGNVSRQRFVNIVNDVLNATNSGNYALGIELNKSKEKKYEFDISGNAIYTRSVSSLYSNNTTSYWTYNIQPNAALYLPWKFELHTDAEINLRQKTVLFPTSNNTVRWNAWVGKKLLKKDPLLLKVMVNDLLNQNIGFNRTATSNYITQNTYSTIQRYFMVSLVWSFTKAGTAAPPQQ